MAVAASRTYLTVLQALLQGSSNIICCFDRNSRILILAAGFVFVRNVIFAGSALGMAQDLN